MATVIIRPQAERDLTAIGDRIAADNPARAITFIAEIRAEGQLLASFPKRRPVVPEIGPDIRRHVHKNYVILYRYDAGDDTVYILRISEGHRDLTKLKLD